MIKRPPRHQRNRTRLSVTNTPPGSAITTAFSIVATKARLTFNAPVVVSGLPTGITRQAGGAGAQLLPTAITVVAANVVDLTYAASVVATDVLTIPAGVSEIRGSAGGFVAAAVHTF
jgi:hypothetical protein